MQHFEVTADDVLLAYDIGEAEAEDRARIEFLLELAEARLLISAPGLPDRVASGAVDPILVKGALCEVVGRVVLNEAPHVQSSQSGAGPFQLTERSRWGTDRVQWGSEDLKGLLPRVASSPGGSFRVRLGW